MQFVDQDYIDVASGQTGATISTRKGTVIKHIVVIPETTGAGTIALLDGATSVNIFVTGTLTSLQPFSIFLDCRSKNGGWTITTGANVHVRVVGNFA